MQSDELKIDADELKERMNELYVVYALFREPKGNPLTCFKKRKKSWVQSNMLHSKQSGPPAAIVDQHV